METISVNLNRTVLVKITARGYEVMKQNYEDLFTNPNYRELHPFKYPEVDGNGYTRMQLWEVMHEFGHAMHNGCDVPIETEILLPEY
jgi:hypothetical protein